ncbi:hypothetical protein AcV7_005300 [Taiwanofungus camphoratus]|nr:hypothetical protein AcV7_005300 [Antrodia cinnamomea]
MFALVFALAALFSLAAATGRTLESLAKQCRFSLDHRRYDLCPILEGNAGGWTIEHERQTPPTITKTVYRIGLTEPLKKEDGVPNHEQCPEGTWVCMTISNRRPKHDDESPRVLQAVPIAGELSIPNKGDSLAVEDYYPGLNITAKLVPTDDERRDILHVRLHGGYYVHKQQKADFQFICDHKAEEPTTPSASWNFNGTYAFTWRTKHACSQALPGRTSTATPAKPTKAPESEPDPDAPPKDDESEGDERKLIDPDIIAGRSRRSMMTAFLSSAAVIFLVMYTVYFPPRRLQHFITSYVKSHPSLLRSRVGERVLVRWAHEDFGLEAGEEDVMVNADGQFEALAMDEQIPLKPSPRRSAALANYGSAL